MRALAGVEALACGATQLAVLSLGWCRLTHAGAFSLHRLQQRRAMSLVGPVMWSEPGLAGPHAAAAHIVAALRIDSPPRSDSRGRL